MSDREDIMELFEEASGSGMETFEEGFSRYHHGKASRLSPGLRIKSMWLCGLTVLEIERATHLSETAVRKWLRKQGIQEGWRRSYGSYHRIEKLIPFEQRAIRLYVECGLGCTTISRLLGVPTCKVSRLIRDHGFTRDLSVAGALRCARKSL